MAKYLLHPKHPLRTIAYVIIAVGLVVGGFVTLKASQTSTEGRSKAAIEGRLEKGWEFTTDKEGWQGKGLKSLTVGKGKLVASIKNSAGNASITNNAVNQFLPRGNKILRLQMAVSGNIVGVFEEETGETDVSVDDQADLCVTNSNGVTTCSTNAGGSTQPGSSEGGYGSSSRGRITGTWTESDTQYPCVFKPECKPGRICLEPLLYPRGGWCATPTPTPACVFEPTPFCPTQAPGETGTSLCTMPVPPPGGWCGESTPTPSCQERHACLDAKPACKFLEPPGGWCPQVSVAPFTFTVFYEVETGSGEIRASTEGKETFSGLADGNMKPYSVKIPVIGDATVKNLRIVFTQGVDAGDTVSFNYIRLMSGSGSNPPGRPTAGVGSCGETCNRNRDCASGLKCIVPSGRREGIRSKVCAGRVRNNNRGYSCPGNEN